MTYLSIARFWKYQNADVWNKSKGHPPWFKFYVHRDQDLDELDPMARLLFYELLGAATRYGNVLKADLSESEANLKWLWAETRIEEEVIREHLPALLKGGWIKVTSTARRSRKVSRGNRDKARDLKEEEEEVIPPLPPLEKGGDLQNSLTPRAQGTNPRAVEKRDKLRRVLAEYVRAYWDEYPDTTILLDELTDRGCTRDEAVELIQRERSRRVTA